MCLREWLMLLMRRYPSLRAGLLVACALILSCRVDTHHAHRLPWTVIATQKATDLLEVEVRGVDFRWSSRRGDPDQILIRDRPRLDALHRFFGRRDMPARAQRYLNQGGSAVLIFRFRDGTVAEASFHHRQADMAFGREVGQILWQESELAYDVDELRRTARAVAPDQVLSVEFIGGSKALAKLDGTKDAAAVRKLWARYREADPYGPAFGDLKDRIVVTYRKNGEAQSTRIKADFRRMREQYSPEVEKVTVGIIEGLRQR